MSYGGMYGSGNVYGIDPPQSSLVGALELVAAPGGRIVTLAQAARQCKFIDPDGDTNTYLGELIDRATRFCEQEISGQRAFLPKTYDLPLNDWSWCRPLRLPRPPLCAVAWLKYYDTSGTLATLATSGYTVRAPESQPGTIERVPFTVWPAFQGDRAFPITIRFTAGYLSPVTADAAANTLTSTGRAFTDTQRVKAWNIGGTLPAPLQAFTDYWVVGASGQTLQLAATPGGSALDLTTVGTGLNYVGDFPETIQQAVLLAVSYWHENRGDVDTLSQPQMLAVKRILDGEGWGSYA